MERINSILFIYLIIFSTISSLPHSQRKLASLTLDSSNWSYDSTNNVYYQIGVTYCTTPASTTYETLGIYVPGEYMTCKTRIFFDLYLFYKFFLNKRFIHCQKCSICNASKYFRLFCYDCPNFIFI